MRPPHAAAVGRLSGFVRRCEFPSDDRSAVVCGVSGGADSAALLILTAAWAAQRSVPVTAVHVDHGIRLGSAAEADRVAELCSRLGAGFRSESVTVSPGPNLEARARDARHAVLGPDALLGHTADDQAETVLLHLMRGGALDALAAMRPDRRPLLSLRRADTEQVCELSGYEPFSDPSNRDPRFLRNRVRHELLPLMCDIASRDVVPLLARSARIAAAESDLLKELACELDPADAATLSSAQPALARRAVREWLRTSVVPSADAVERVLRVARGETGPVQISEGRTVSLDGRRLRVGPTPPRSAAG